MTAKKWAELAFHDAQTQALAGNDGRAFAITSQALAVIARYGNQIPPTVQYVGRDGGSVLAMFQASCAGGTVDSDTERREGNLSGKHHCSEAGTNAYGVPYNERNPAAGAIPAHQRPVLNGGSI